jgi:hypothetical protein
MLLILETLDLLRLNAHLLNVRARTAVNFLLLVPPFDKSSQLQNHLEAWYAFYWPLMGGWSISLPWRATLGRESAYVRGGEVSLQKGDDVWRLHAKS